MAFAVNSRKEILILTIGFLGGDRRMEIAADWIKREGHTVRVCKEGVPKNAFFAALELLVLPYPATRDGVHIAATALPFSRLPLSPEAALFGGRLPDAWREGRRSFDAEENEAYLLENACLTAAAGVATVLRATERALYGVSAAVIGYGRIGKETARLLRALGADTAVYARREAAVSEARGDGHRAYLLSQTPQIPETVVFGTVPAPADSLSSLLVAEEALVYDLGGGLPVAMDTPSGKSIPTLPLRSAPGVFAPKAAGEAYGRCVLAALSHMERNDTL